MGFHGLLWGLFYILPYLPYNANFRITACFEGTESVGVQALVAVSS
jgi:hypothetical protein